MKLLLLASAILSIFLQTAGSDYNEYSDSGEDWGLYAYEENDETLGPECKLPLLYNSQDNICYKAYTQGPCPSGHYYVLAPGENVPECEKNPCREDGLVPFEGNCHQIYVSGYPCEFDQELTVKGSNFELACYNYENYPPAPGAIINAPMKVCPKGSRRVGLSCKRMF